ncbi:MAG: hypothetical protein K0S39_4867 [Paenibacillus sp.]|jgi:hypothetical protein|nr:hypothetical protein [Paenibacillus sp.]
MMCQEVIELMQRYLDQDLDEMEYNQMLGHMKQCADCTELFQRLVLLSHELEQLPKVTPAYSLVDAIMPKLQQIDMGMPVEDITAGGHTSAPLVTDAAEPSEAIKPQVTELAGWRKRMRGLVSTRIVGGVVAAGLVLGFFVFQQQQQGSMKIADDRMLPAGAAQQSKSAGADTKAASPESKFDTKSSAAMDAASPTKETSNAAEPNSGGSNGTAPQSPNVQAPASTPAQSNKTDQQNQLKSGAPAGAAASQGKSEAAIQAPEAADKSKQPAPDSRSNNTAAGEPVAKRSQPSGTTQDEKPSAQLAPPPVAPQGDAGNEDPSSSSSNSAASPGISSFAPPEMSLKQAPEQPKTGITSHPPDTNAKSLSDDAGSGGYRSSSSRTLASPNGTYTASVSSDKHVVITDQQGKQVFTSNRTAAETDNVTLVKWESDSKLSYQISGGTGTTVYVINVTEKTDMKK